jgi:hypothetical protein
MPWLATLVAIGSILLFVFTAIFTAFSGLGLGAHPRIAIVLLSGEILTAVIALLFMERKPRRRKKR